MTNINLNLGQGENGEEFSEKQKELIKKSASALQNIINLEKFKNRIRTFSFDPRFGKKKYYFRMSQNKNRNEILNLLLSGEDIYSEADQELDYIILPYKTKPSVHAYTTSGSSNIYLNQNYIEYYINNYFENKIIAALSNTLIHEYLHNLGFKHRGNKPTKYNKTTVPYAIGNIVYDLILDQGTFFTEDIFPDLENEFNVNQFCEHNN